MIGVRSVIEVVRETTHLSGKHKGEHTRETIYYVCTWAVDASRADELLERIRPYWTIEGGLHQRLDVTRGEDRSRVRNRNALLVLGILRRTALSIYELWHPRQKNQRHTTMSDFYTAMSRFNQREAFSLVNAKEP